MHHHYHDITSRIDAEPIWYDENAVPRYEPFSPDDTADIYCDEAALVEIACQNCGTHFLVAFTSDRSWNQVFGRMGLAESIRDHSLHFGDPPNAGCCGSGATMNCDDLRVCEYWSKGGGKYHLDWVRDPALEIAIDTIYSVPADEVLRKLPRDMTPEEDAFWSEQIKIKTEAERLAERAKVEKMKVIRDNYQRKMFESGLWSKAK